MIYLTVKTLLSGSSDLHGPYWQRKSTVNAAPGSKPPPRPFADTA
ncbi:hypothetical protein HMPREF0574_1099 [Mobiluncus curtisii subsp. curtisii ATCC 35241]|nr:hypothetical protein HMPREF0574_1099 [Mobiluncus curtisii subsp. curtisii ATCC 35241]